MLPFAIQGLLAAAIGSAVVNVAKSYDKEQRDIIYESEVFSKVPDEFLNGTFPITMVAEILNINVETLRRRIRNGNLNITNKDTVGGRTGYAIAGTDFMNISRELSKQDRLAEFLHLKYNVSFSELLDKASVYDRYGNNLALLNVDVNTFAEKKINSIVDYKENKPVFEEKKDDKLVIQSDVEKLEKDLLKMEIALTENKIKIINVKIEKTNNLEEKVRLMSEQIELQKKLITQCKQLQSV